MPREAIAIREVERAVSRPIAFAIIRELFPRWGIDNHEKASLRMFGTTDSLPTTHSTLHKEAKPQRLFNDLAVSIEVDENYVEYGAGYQPYKEKEAVPIFNDPYLRIGVRPVYREVQAVISVTFEAKSRTHAQQIGRKMQAEMRAYSQYDHHEVEYHYQIRPEIILIMKELWELRDKNFRYADTFEEWFNKYVDPRITTNYNHGNKGHQLAIRESQVSIIGYYDFSDPPRTNPNDTGHKHEYTFSYKYTYMRPEHLIMYYPIAIHNQMIPDRFIDKEKILDASDFYGVAGWSHRSLMELNYANGRPNLEQRVGGIKVPFYDDWDNFTFSASFEPMFTALLYFNEEKPKELINISDMGSWKFKESLMKYIQKRKKGNFRPFDSIVQFTLHEWEKIKDWDLMSIDENFVISFDGGRHGRNNYHFITCLVTDPSRLTDDAIRDLLEDGDLTKDYLDTIYPGIGDQIGKYPDPNDPKKPRPPIILNPDGSLDRDLWDKIIEWLIERIKPNRSRDRVFTNIITFHKGDLT